MQQLLPVFGGKSATDLTESLPQVLETWMDGCWLHVGNGVRRRNLEHLVLYCRLETVGVLTATQQEWLFAFVTKVLWDFKNNSACIFMLLNRSEQMRWDCKSEPPGPQDETEEETDIMSVRDANRNFMREFEKQTRGLAVRDNHGCYSVARTSRSMVVCYDGVFHYVTFNYPVVSRMSE